MTPVEFIHKWGRSELRERQGAQEHFIDLCRLLGEKTPAEADPAGTSYCFERGASKVGGGDGWADVWKRGCFGIEYKGKHKDLGAALRQLQIYAPDLENPPYLVVCDMERIVVHTNWTNTVRNTWDLGFDKLREPATLDLLRDVFAGSDARKPGLSPQALTAIVAERFGDLGKRLQDREHDPRSVAHFLNRIIFCLFAEDADLLPKGLFTRLVVQLSRVQYNVPKKTVKQLDELFAKMAEGGFFGADELRWFNGGLFDAAPALPLERDDLDLIAKTAKEHDWSQIDPAVFGTMFEAALKTTGRRAALGAHYTDREKILKIVDPVIVRPLQAEWTAALADITTETEAMAAAEAQRKDVLEAGAAVLARDPARYRKGEAARRKEIAGLLRHRDDALRRATERRDAFLVRLAAFRVLDPACGSGNFLYVALHALRDIELRAILDAERAGVPQVRPRVGLDAVRGIEIEPYAAELARVTLWIGNLQWERRNGFRDPDEPVLAALDTIEPRDALLNADGSEAEWPAADVIIGNPPFLGNKRLREALGDDRLAKLFRVYHNRVSAEADFVCYWVEKAWQEIQNTRGIPATQRAGLVTTNSIRGGANRRILDRIASAQNIWEAWADEPWVLKGASVRVSMVGFGIGFQARRLSGLDVSNINADLTASEKDITKAKRLAECANISFIGAQKNGKFDIASTVAREWLKQPLNPNGRPNSDVIKPWINGQSIVDNVKDNWIVDFGVEREEAIAALYEKPFEYIFKDVRPSRLNLRRDFRRTYWWLFGEPMPAMRKALKDLPRYIVTPRVAKHRLFVWSKPPAIPESAVAVIAKDDDTMFGLLHSKFHEIWSLALCTWLGVGNDPRYTPTTTFESFPFPNGLTPDLHSSDYAITPNAIAIAAAAAELNRLREAWLNPPDLVRIEPEVVPGYPDRILPKDEEAAQVLKKRTLTNLYNERPAWLDNAHRALDAAVAAAYGWPADLADDEILARLFALNQDRAAAGR